MADPVLSRPSLRRQVMVGLLVYVALLSIAVGVHGYLVNEHAERLVWQTLLDAELDHLQERIAREPTYRWADTTSMALYDSAQPDPIPASLATLTPGLHDEVTVGGAEKVALVRVSQGRRLVLTLDLADFEQRERDMTLTVIGSALTLLLVLGVLVALNVSRLVEPLSQLARRIGDLRPDQPGQQLVLTEGSTAELAVIAQALNGYLARNDRFVERERLFIDMASHELRTPIAVIAGASELALGAAETPPATRLLVDRIRTAAKGVQELIGLLLVLAKDPARLRERGARVRLDRLMPGIVADHEHLARHKDLSIVLDVADDVAVDGPQQIVQAAIGNLLRNAIENSDRGVVHVQARHPGVVVIEDPGHGMTAEEIGAVYSRIARGGGDRDGGGIGMELMARLCEHLGWQLDIDSAGGKGTRARLSFSAADNARQPRKRPPA